MAKMVQQLFWSQKLTKWCNFWAQKLTLYIYIYLFVGTNSTFRFSATNLIKCWFPMIAAINGYFIFPINIIIGPTMGKHFWVPKNVIVKQVLMTSEAAMNSAVWHCIVCICFICYGLSPMVYLLCFICYTLSAKPHMLWFICYALSDMLWLLWFNI